MSRRPEREVNRRMFQYELAGLFPIIAAGIVVILAAVLYYGFN
jgi:hypothetical protein